MKHARSDYNRRIVDLDGLIPENEPVFLLRGQDKLAPKLLLMWASDLRLNGGDPIMARSAEDHAQEMINWQKTHTCKTPDMYISKENTLLMERLSELLTADKIELKEVLDVVDKLYGPNGNVITLLPVDLKSDSKDVRLDDLTLDNFEIMESTTGRFNVTISKLIIFIDKTGKFKVLKNEITTSK